MSVYLGKNKVSTYFKEYTVEPTQFDLVDLTVTPTGALQTIYPDSGEYFKKVIVEGDANLTASNIKAGVSIYGVAGTYDPQLNISLQPITITPSQGSQTLYVPSGYDGYGTITVNPVSSSIDSDIIPENIRSGVNILGVVGTLTPGATVSGTLNITSNGTFDVSDYASVFVDVPTNTEIPAGYILPTGERTVTSNGTYDISTFTSVRVQVPIPSGYIIPSGSQTLTANATYDVSNLSQVVVNVPIPSGYIQPSGTKTITANGNSIDVRTYRYVNVNVASAKPEQSKSVTPSTSAQTVLPDSGYALSSVSVAAIPSNYIIPSGSQTITTNGSYDVTNKSTVVVNVPGETHNFVYSSTEPVNASAGTIWFKPIE